MYAVTLGLMAAAVSAFPYNVENLKVRGEPPVAAFAPPSGGSFGPPSGESAGAAGGAPAAPPSGGSFGAPAGAPAGSSFGPPGGSHFGPPGGPPGGFPGGPGGPVGPGGPGGWGPPLWTACPTTGASPTGSLTNPTGPVSTGKGDTYTLYKGDGTIADGWPAKKDWVDFDTMWKNNQVLIRPSCQNLDTSLANDSPQEINNILQAINTVSSSTGVPRRFILAVMIEESKGCVRAPTTFSVHPNPGLMQSFNGKGTCNRNGIIQNPCPASEITQMIKDGTAGTIHGPGLVQDLKAAHASDVSRYYKAARIYNSGSIPAGGNLDAPGSNRCYVSDIANRLTGWVLAPTKCFLTN